jgi:hypothetical protein
MYRQSNKASCASFGFIPKPAATLGKDDVGSLPPDVVPIADNIL